MSDSIDLDRKTIAALLISTSMAQACAVYEPAEFDVLPVGVPDQFSGPAVERGSVLYWQDVIDNEVLTSLINHALTENLDIGIARDRLNASRAELGINSAERFPSVDMDLGIEESRLEDRTAINQTNILVGGALSWEIDVWRRIDSLFQSATLDALAQQELVRDAELIVVAELIHIYQEIFFTEQLIQLVEGQIETNAEFLELTRFRLANGQATTLDVLRQQSQLLATEALQVGLSQDLARLQTSISVLSGTPPGGDRLSNVAAADLTPPAKLPSPMDLVDLRPDLRASFAQLKAADYRVAAAVADRLPRLSFSLNAVMPGASLGSIGDTNATSIGLDLFAPVFDAGLRVSEVERRQAIVSEYQKQFAQNTLNALKGVEDALSDLSTLDQQITLKRAQFTAAKGSATLSRQRYVEGDGDYLTVLDALRSEQDVSRELIALQRQRAYVIVTLYKSLGTRWGEPSSKPPGDSL